MKVVEAAEALGITEDEVMERIESGEIEARKQGRGWSITGIEVSDPNDPEAIIERVVGDLRTLKKVVRKREKEIRAKVADAIVEALG